MANIHINLSQRQVSAGELVSGHVKLSAREPIEAQAFVLAIFGFETLSWRTRHGVATKSHRAKHLVFHAEISIVDKSKRFMPIGVELPFEYELPRDSPSTFSITKSHVNLLSMVKFSVAYKVTAHVKRPGASFPTFIGEKPVVVRAAAFIPPHPSLPLGDTVSSPVFLMRCIKIGDCEITATTSSSYIDNLNGTVRVHVSVRNTSSSDVTGVYVSLYQVLTVRVPRRGGPRQSVERVLYRTVFDKIGEDKKDLVAEISIAKAVGAFARATTASLSPKGSVRPLQLPPQSPFPATCDMNFVSVSYNIEVYCCFAWASAVKLDFPLQLFKL